MGEQIKVEALTAQDVAVLIEAGWHPWPMEG